MNNLFASYLDEKFYQDNQHNIFTMGSNDEKKLVTLFLSIVCINSDQGLMKMGCCTPHRFSPSKNPAWVILKISIKVKV